MDIRKLTYFKEINDYFYLTNYPRDEFIKLFNDCLESVDVEGKISDAEFCGSVWESVNNHLENFGRDNKWEVLRQYAEPEENNLEDARWKFEDDLYNVAKKIREQNLKKYFEEEMDCE